MSLGSPGYRTSAKRFCRAGASLLLAMHAGCSSLFGLPAAGAPESSLQLAGRTESGEAVPLPDAQPALQQSARCTAAWRLSLEVAPELLALADWPLDGALPVACVGGDDSSDAPLVLAEAGFEAGFEAKSVAETGTADAIAAGDADAQALPGEREQAMTGTSAGSSTSAGPSEIDVPPLATDNPLGGQLAALGAESLDEIRGGFELADSNLKFSFGIERAVFINGQLVASTVLNLKDLQWAAGGSGAPQAPPIGGAAGPIDVIQNGSGNTFAAQAANVAGNLAGTVIQNTLNDQRIQNVTTINAAVNSAQVLRALSVQSAIQQGIVSSLRR